MSARKYRIGVIGSTKRGDYGHGLDTAWSEHPNSEVVAVADDDKGGLASAAGKLKVGRTFGDYRKMIDEVKPDVVAICPRWVDQHRDMTLAAVERGIHVYMEKPFCRNLDEADELIAAAAKTKARIAIAHPTRYSPKLETVWNLIREGAIGRVLEYRGRGKEDHRGGAEDLWVLGSHMLDVVLALAGLPQWCEARVTLQGRPIQKSDVIDGPEGLGPLAGDSVTVRYGLTDGESAYFASRKNGQGKPSRYGLQIVGTGGILDVVEGTMPAVKILQSSGWNLGRNEPAWQDVSSAGIGKSEPLTDAKYRSRHYLAIADLFDAIESERAPKCSAEAARDVLQMILAVFESQRIGGPASLPLTNRKHPLSML